MLHRPRLPHVGALALSMCLASATADVGAAPVDVEPAVADQRPVHWQVQLVPAAAKAGDDAEIVFRANVAPGWILYSTDFKLEIGPRPARFTFEPNPGVMLVGSVRPIGASRKKDRSLGGEYTYFAGKAEFRQSVHLARSLSGPTAAGPTATGPIVTGPTAATPLITGRIDGQACFEQSGLCELLRESFTVAP